MRFGSVVRATSSVATIKACLNVQFVGEKTVTIFFSTDSFFMSLFPLFNEESRILDAAFQRLLEPGFKKPSNGGPCCQIGHIRYI